MREEIAREYLMKKCKKYEDKIYDAEIRLTVLKGFDIALSIYFYMITIILLAYFIGNNIPKDTNPTELLSMFIALELLFTIVFYSLNLTIIRYLVFGKQYRIKHYYEKRYKEAREWIFNSE